MRYSPPLDGIRAVAILAVLIFHISPSALRGGFTGVDVFFVLSGFLITSIILHDLRDGSFSLREFYLRRIQRLLPNLVAMVLAVLFLWTALMPPGAARQAARHGLWTIFEASNFYIWRYIGGYWGDGAEWSPLTHTWSLGVEEQFYLLFPGVLLFLAHRQPRQIKSWLILGAISSFGLCLYVSSAHPSAAFYMLPTRIWELLIGAALAAHRVPLASNEAAHLASPGVKGWDMVGPVGLGMIALGFFLIDNDNSFPGPLALLPTIGTGLVLWTVLDRNTWLTRLLSSRPFVQTGKASYSIYLWHWPLITLGKALAILYARPQIYGAIAGGVAGVALGWIAFALIEQPLRRRGPGRSKRFAVIAATFSIAAILSAIILVRRPIADPAHRFDPVAFYGEQYTAGDADGSDSATRSTRYYDVYFPSSVPDRPKDLWRKGGVVHLYGSAHPQVVVLGSSHALMYSKLIDDICRQMGLSVAFLGVDATPIYFESTVNFNFPSPQVAREFDLARERWLLAWHPDVVFLIDRWETVKSANQEFNDKLHSLLVKVCPNAGHVVFVAQVPAIDDRGEYNLRELVTWRARKNNALPALSPDANEPVRRLQLSQAEAETGKFPNLSVLRADLPFYNEDGSVRYAAGRSFYYADSDHLSESGAELLRDLFQNAIKMAKFDRSPSTGK